MGERISTMEQTMHDLQTKLDEVASKEAVPADGGAADGELAQKLEELAAKMAADSETVEKMQEKVDDLRKKEGKTLAEIERHVADQLRVTMENFSDNMEKLRSETSAPQIKEELDRKIHILEEFQEGTLPALDEVKSSAEKIRAALVTALDECLGELDGGQTAGQ
jgi:DNA repair exonuclease SbcCD ATPase subunit